MARSGQRKSNQPQLGFLSVVEHAQHGYFGGLLLLDQRGRPLEFHCTTPVRPTRAQEILYGISLVSFMFGEQIGATLLAKAKGTPDVVLVDDTRTQAVEEHIDVPVVLVKLEEQDNSSESNILDLDYANGGKREGVEALATRGLPRSGDVSHIIHGRHRLQLGESSPREQISRLAKTFSAVGESFDLCEPFERIHLAIDEAQRGTGH